MASATISSHSTWGVGTSRYAVYCLDVSYKNSTYRLYRRYRTFLSLHQALTTKFPEEMTPLQEIFPAKGSLGSMINSFDAVVNERIIRLQQYLQDVLSHEKIKNDEIMLNFFDVTNQGASGLRKSVGSSQILKETNLQASYISLLGLYSWSSYFVGLTKRGVLYIFKTLYDAPDEAITRIDLRSVDARVVGMSSNSIIKIFNGEHKIYLKFQSTEEFSSWLRQLSDFGVSAASRQSGPSKNSSSPSNQNNRSTLDDINERYTSNSQHHHHQQQSNAGEADDFSSTYGM